MFFDFAKARTLADVTQAHVEDYLAHVAQDQSQKSMLDKLVIIRSAGRWAVKRGYIAANPAEAVEVRKPARMPVKIIDARAVEKMIDEKKSPGTRALLALAAYAGMRRAEIIALRWDEIDLTGRWIDVSNREDRRTKTGVNRRVPILDPLLSYLVALPRTGPRVFPTVNDLRAASRRGPLQVLRHTAITSWLRSGASIGTCAEWAGNSNDVIESNYRARQCPDPVRFTFHGLPLVPHGLPEVPAGLRKVQ
jgi:integrase/recombinase XerC